MILNLGDNMSKPVWVQVLWSECSRFKENELMTYIDFEIRALKAAIKKGYGKGYWKTKVDVLFDDGNRYECRLDLAPHDTHGFEHHAKRLISWFETNQGHLDEADFSVRVYRDNYNFLKQIEWPQVPA